MPMLTDMHEYKSSRWSDSTLDEVYQYAFRRAFPDAFAKNGECPTCNSLDWCAEQLKRFRLDCDLGQFSIELREAEPGEDWTVPVAEAFLEYLSLQTTLAPEVYGIDVTEILGFVAKFAADEDPLLMRFMPPSIFTEEWVLWTVNVVPSILSHIEVDEAILVKIVEREPVQLICFPANIVTKNVALAALRIEPTLLEIFKSPIKMDVAYALLREFGDEIHRLKKQLSGAEETTLLVASTLAAEEVV